MKINIIKTKKAIAFSFLAFFVSVIIFAFIYFNLSQDNYTKDNIFKKSRIEYVDSEIKFFKDTYLKSAVSFSLYNTMDELLIYINDTSSDEINQNYTRLNELIFTGIYKGNFSGTLIPNFENKTLNYFIETFKDEFYINHKGNFSYEILNINIYEKIPYHLTIQILGRYNVTTIDNISVWNFEDNLEVSLPVYNLKDPELFFQEGRNIPITPSEVIFGTGNWTLNSLNETINNTYTSIFIEPKHDYTIGNSYLNRLLNISRSSYRNVIGYWNFDSDEKKGEIYDSSLNATNSKHFGNTRLAYSFDSSTINGLTINDLSSYNSTGTMNAVLNCSTSGSKNQACYFNNTDHVTVSNNKLNLSDTNKVSISAWVRATDSDFEIFRYGSANSLIELSYDSSSRRINFEIGAHNSGSYKNFISNTNVSIGNWTHIIAIFNGDTGEGKIFVNGFWDNILGYNDVDKTDKIDNFLSANPDIQIGKDLIGKMDEIGVFSKVLTNLDVAKLYDEKKVLLIDYQDSLYKKSLSFDGENDYVQINQDIFKSNLNNFTIETWIKFDEIINQTNLTILSVPHNVAGNILKLKIVNSTQIEFASINNVPHSLIANFSFYENINYHIIFNFDGTTKSIYINNKLIKSVPLNTDLTSSNQNLYFGATKSGPNFSEYFKGQIDEIKIYSSSLTENEIEQNYYNYNTFGNGCCNYLTLINPNKFGYNNPAYLKNVSYSTRLFYDYYNHGRFYNISLNNLTSITSKIQTQNYYNFIFDRCIVDAYNIDEYAKTNNNITRNWVTINTLDDDSCSSLVKMGVY